MSMNIIKLQSKIAYPITSYRAMMLGQSFNTHRGWVELLSVDDDDTECVIAIVNYVESFDNVPFDHLNITDPSGTSPIPEGSIMLVWMHASLMQTFVGMLREETGNDENRRLEIRYTEIELPSNKKPCKIAVFIGHMEIDVTTGLPVCRPDRKSASTSNAAFVD